MDYKPEDTSPQGEGKKEMPTEDERLSPSYLAPTSPPEKDTDTPGPRIDSPFIPGVLQVVLKEGLDGRRIAEQLQDGDPHDDDPIVSRLRNILDPHQFDRIELPFDQPPPGLEKEKDPPAGRERFLTIYFSARENTRLISRELLDSNLVEEAVPASILAPPSSPLNDPYTVPSASGESDQWYIQRCRIDAGWQLKGRGQFFSGQGVILADLDWGFRMLELPSPPPVHPDLAGRVEHTYNSITGLPYVGSGESYSHGIAVLGLLGAAANGRGMSGIAYGAALWAIQAGRGQLSGMIPNFTHWKDAIEYVRRAPGNGRPKVICLEVQTIDGRNVESEPMVRQAITEAIADGVVVCVAAGNGDRDAGLNSLNRRFTATGSILVGATVYDANVNRKLDRSNWGPSVVMAAPGDPSNDRTCNFSNSLDPNTLYRRNFGNTSGAVAKVAGVAALMLEANPQLTHDEVRDILYATGTAVTAPPPKPIGRFLNAAAAIAEAQRRALVADAVAV